MKRGTFIGLVAILAFALATVSHAQTQNPLVGAWERFSHLDDQGKSTQPPMPAAFVIFSSNGFFSQTAIPTGRPKVNMPLDQMTKEQLLQRFNLVEARRGTFKIDGNRLTRTSITHSNPNAENWVQEQLFRIEGDVLILSSVDPKSKFEARFRRVK